MPALQRLLLSLPLACPLKHLQLHLQRLPLAWQTLALSLPRACLCHSQLPLLLRLLVPLMLLQLVRVSLLLRKLWLALPHDLPSHCQMPQLLLWRLQLPLPRQEMWRMVTWDSGHPRSLTARMLQSPASWSCS